MKCPSVYFSGEQSLVCAEGGNWKTSGPFAQCRHQCGNHEGRIARWDMIIRKKNSDANICHASIINSVYLITRQSCVAQYHANEVILWDYGTKYPIQSIEYGGIFTIIRSKVPIKFSGNTMPVCVDDGNGSYKGGWSWIHDPIKECRPKKIEYGLHNCTVNDSHCIYGLGGGYHHRSKNEIEGLERRYLLGIGDSAGREEEDKDGVYKCDVSYHDEFKNDEYLDIDFLDYSPKAI